MYLGVKYKLSANKSELLGRFRGNSYINFGDLVRISVWIKNVFHYLWFVIVFYLGRSKAVNGDRTIETVK